MDLKDFTEYYSDEDENKTNEKQIIFIKDVVPYNNDLLDTLPLHKYSNKTNFIKNNSLGRIFYSEKNNKVCYFEIFYDELILEIQNLSNQISFLFLPLENDNSNYDQKKCFGFRYYNDNNKKDINNYFTLIKNIKDEDFKEFFILEKSQEEQFKKFNSSIDCFKIIKSIIINKYKKNSFPLGEPFPIILGFSYASQFLDIKFLPVHRIKLFDNIDFTENICIDKEIIYLCPIVYKEHISVLYIKNSPKKMYLLIDMGLTHCINDKHPKKDEFFFPKMNNVVIYPKFQIQENNSCALWYYAQILTLYEKQINEKKKYETKKDFFNGLDDKTFFIDTLNTINFILNNNDYLIEIKSEKANDKKNCYYINNNISYKIDIMSFSNNFFNIEKFFTKIIDMPTNLFFLT